MPRKLLFVGVCTILVVLAWYLASPPSDDALLTRFDTQPEIRQIVEMYRADRQPMAINANGRTFPDDLTSQGISSARLATYVTLLRRAGVSWTTGDGLEGGVTLHYPAPLEFLLGPVKSIVYTPTQPPLITTNRTDDYTFLPSQYRRVCRPIESNWYICKDYED